VKIVKLNVIAGALGLVVFSFYGFFLGSTFNTSLTDEYYVLTVGRFYMKQPHTHGFPLAMYNLILAVVLPYLGLTERSKKVCSVLAVCSYIMTIGLFLKAITDGAPTYAPVVMVGAILFTVSAIMLLFGSFKIKS
jgi:hypothetical protein